MKHLKERGILFIKHPLATDESFTIDTIENLSEKLEHRYGQHTSTDIFRFSNH